MKASNCSIFKQIGTPNHEAFISHGLRMDSGAFEEFWKQFGGVSKLARDGWQMPWLRFQTTGRKPSKAPFRPILVPYGSTGGGLEDGIIFQHRRLAVAREDDRRVAGTHGSSCASSRPSMCGCMQVPGWLEKS